MNAQKNVLTFPTNRIVRDIPSERKKEIMDKKFQEEIEEATYTLNQEVIDMILSVAPETYDKDVFAKDVSFSSAVIAATVARMHNLPHPLHSFIDAHVKTMPPPPEEELEIEVELEDDIGENNER